MKQAEIKIRIVLGWNPAKGEDPRGALAAALVATGEGIANGKASGPLPNDGTWSLLEDFDADRIGKT